VWDASALLALLQREPGADKVARALDAGSISSVNWSEVCMRALERGLDAGRVGAHVRAVGLAIVAFAVDDAEQAARLREPTRHLGLSLADRACLALASRLGRPALTADRRWLDLDVDVRVESIR
jgi:PIN domain nuclease of toxin-antitoxin system